jgi:hypothetical protein
MWSSCLGWRPPRVRALGEVFVSQGSRLVVEDIPLVVWGLCLGKVGGVISCLFGPVQAYLYEHVNILAMFCYNLPQAEPEEDWPPLRGWFLSWFLFIATVLLHLHCLLFGLGFCTALCDIGWCNNAIWLIVAKDSLRDILLVEVEVFFKCNAVDLQWWHKHCIKQDIRMSLKIQK